MIFNYETMNNKNFNTESFFKFNEIYRITSLFNDLSFKIIKNNFIKLDSKQSYFRLLLIKSNLYYIESLYNKNRLGIDSNDKIKIYKKDGIAFNSKTKWFIIKLFKNNYLIKNEFNNKYIKADNFEIQCTNRIINFLNNSSIELNKKYIFNFLKLYVKGIFEQNHLKYINKEPIDLLIKYIDLTDKSLNRIGIKQIYKDKDNEELRYSLRSVLENLPWIRKIYILMPNLKIRYFKSIEQIKEKIVYIKDKDILGFDSANIFAFTFNLYKLEKFGISKNFIYMEDDFFIGKLLKKSDFFYYDEKVKKVLPYLLTKYFREMNNTEIFNQYNNLYKIKDFIHPHSRFGWWLSIYCTDRYFIQRYKFPLINTNFTHNAIAENIDDLKEIFHEIKNYEYINETLFYKERYILTLNQPHFVNLYQLNIKHKKVNSIPYKYIELEKMNKYKLNSPLFVVNTGGNHIPLTRQYKIQKKIMEIRFPIKTKYEIISSKKIEIYFFKNIYTKILYIMLLSLFLLLIFQ